MKSSDYESDHCTISPHFFWTERGVTFRLSVICLITTLLHERKLWKTCDELILVLHMNQEKPVVTSFTLIYPHKVIMYEN